jgi:hypothetical protein
MPLYDVVRGFNSGAKTMKTLPQSILAALLVLNSRIAVSISKIL